MTKILGFINFSNSIEEAAESPSTVARYVSGDSEFRIMRNPNGEHIHRILGNASGISQENAKEVISSFRQSGHDSAERALSRITGSAWNRK